MVLVSWVDFDRGYSNMCLWGLTESCILAVMVVSGAVRSMPRIWPAPTFETDSVCISSIYYSTSGVV